VNSACQIIGVLDNGIEGISPQALHAIRVADVLIGGTRTLLLFNKEFRVGSEQLDLTGKLAQIPEWIQSNLAMNKRVVVLATGDPLCHGIASYIVKKVGREKCEIIPNVSTIQLACARLGVPFQDLQIISVHSKDAGEWFKNAGPEHGLYPLLQGVTRFENIAVFTSPDNSPDRIARMLKTEGFADHLTLSVAENLLEDGERIIHDLNVSDAVNMQFARPNVVIIKRTQSMVPKSLFGLKDEEYLQRKPEKGLITKREVRAVSLAHMQLASNSIVWDIGAGSGSIGLEAARLCVEGHVYAIEKNEADFLIADQNRSQQQIKNYSLFNAKAPDGLDGWPDPDAIFIGGSGGELANLIKLCTQRLKNKGCLVMNFVTLENISTAIETLKTLDLDWYVTSVNVSRSQPILHMHRLAAENPVTIITAEKI